MEELLKSKLSKVLYCVLNKREGFFHYLEDRNCFIRNFVAKNCICLFVIGRKNWLFTDGPKEVEVSVGIYTLHG